MSPILAEQINDCEFFLRPSRCHPHYSLVSDVQCPRAGIPAAFPRQELSRRTQGASGQCRRPGYWVRTYKGAPLRVLVCSSLQMGQMLSGDLSRDYCVQTKHPYVFSVTTTKML